MNRYLITEAIHSTERHKLFVWTCVPDELDQNILSAKNSGVGVVNIGKEVALFIDSLPNRKYLQLVTYEFLTEILNRHKTKIDASSNSVLVIFNLGILFEPELQLNPTQLLKDFSKSTTLIILWDNQSEHSRFLHWPTQEKKYYLDFSDILLKYLNHEI